MEVGYLTDEGHLVVVDSIGVRTLFTAYTIRGGTLHVLTHADPLQPLGSVRLRVTLHRQGWGAKGETFVEDTEAQLFAAPGLYVLLGPRWSSVRTRRRGDAREVHWPRGSGRKAMKKEKGVAPPPKHAPLVVLLERASVKGWRRDGRAVDVYAVELREFTDLVLGKMTARLEFANEGAAVAFADELPSAGDMTGLDRRTRVDVDRSKAFTWTKLAATFVVIAAVLFALTFAAIVWAYSIGRMDHVVRGVSAVWTGAFVYAWLWHDVRWTSSREFQDLRRKYPRVAEERWAEGAGDAPEDFIEGMRAMGVRLTRDMRGLATLDRFLRQLPPDTYFRAFAMDAAAYATDVMMRMVRRPVEWRWRWIADREDLVADMPEIDHWVSPVTIIAWVWVNKDPKTLDAIILDQVATINRMLPIEDSEDDEENDGEADEELGEDE